MYCIHQGMKESSFYTGKIRAWVGGIATNLNELQFILSQRPQGESINTRVGTEDEEGAVLCLTLEPCW